ncbi:MAG: hypothetical protein JF586_15850 [Burkholderiales bacterium]|nr:hypothetical protein [Burkholderiales bacterium]
MTERAPAAADWASVRRRRGSAVRLAAAAALNLLVLAALRFAIDRVELPRHGPDRVTRLVTVALHAAPPPPVHALPLRHTPPPQDRTSLHAPSPAHANAPARAAAPPRDDAAPAITLPATIPQAVPPVAAASASAPPADLRFLDNAATRRAIRAVARGEDATVAERGNALTHEEPGSELVAADGTHVGTKRNLPPPPPAVALAQGIDAAHKGDCGKGEYLGGGMGLLSAPFLLAAEALGKCAHKL